MLKRTDILFNLDKAFLALESRDYTFTEAIFHHRQPNGTYAAYDMISAPHIYKSPRFKELTPEEVHIRQVAYSIKFGNSEFMDEAARDMSVFVNGDDVLVPIPSSTGDISANNALCQAIAKITGSRISSIVELRNQRESNHKRVLQGKKQLPPKRLGYSLSDGIDATKVVFVDNVATSGSTMQAVMNLINGGRGLVYAKVPITDL